MTMLIIELNNRNYFVARDSRHEFLISNRLRDNVSMKIEQIRTM